MNVILIISDTLRRDHLGCYGSAVATPHLDLFARDAVVFDRAYPASFPTGPHRQDLHTGRFTFPYQRWTGLAREEVRLGPTLASARINTLMVADTPAIKYGNYTDGFRRSRTWGHWDEPLPPKRPWLELRLPAAPEKLRRPDNVLKYMAYDAARQSEADYFCARTMIAAAQWLEEEALRGPFFLYVDTFDPHEPWFPPPWYLDRYDPGYEGEMVLEPAYEPAGYCTEREVLHMRARYAAMVTMVDAWIGHLLWAIDRLNLRDSTAVIISTDHGFYLADHGLIGKVWLDREDRIIGRYPLYRDIIRIPLLVRAPGIAPGRRQAFVQTPDLMPTILDFAGVPIPDRVQGKSLLPILRGEADHLRDWAISSLTCVQDEACRSPSTLITDEWSYLYGGDEAPHGLFHLPTDPNEEHDRFAAEEALARELHKQYLGVLREIGCPPERIEGRRSWDHRSEARRVEVKYI